jgi:tetratricopeptide (TPR) repeat protein
MEGCSLEITCPLCRKEHPTEVAICERCGADLSLLIILRTRARALYDHGQAQETAGDVGMAKSTYEQAISLWPEVPGANERLQALQLQREEEESAAAHSEAGMKPRVQDAKSRWRALISIAAITCVTVFSVLIWQLCLVRQREEIALGTMDVLHEEISMIQAQLDTELASRIHGAEEQTRVREEYDKVCTLLDAYRALSDRDLSPFLRNPHRFTAILEQPLPDGDRITVERARRWAALQLFGETSQDPKIRRRQLDASIALWPSGYHVDDAYFAIAEIDEMSDPVEAIRDYETVLSLSQGSWYHDDALYAIGRIKLETGDGEGAIEAFTRVHREFPGSEGDRLAMIALRRMGIPIPEDG